MIPNVAEPVGVLGVGVEGRATIDYLLSCGVTDIVALDRSAIDDLPPGVSGCFGDAHDRGLERFATIFRSPSIRPDHPSLVAARTHGTRVTSAISHFLEMSLATVVGVTGTLGKGTTASLIAAMSEAAGFTTHLGGNIGRSPLSFLREVAPEHRVVLEISSFQAMDAAASPRVGVVLKTTSEHLDWHRDQAEYLQAKANLFRHQSAHGVVIYNGDAPASRRIATAGRGDQKSYSINGNISNGISIQENGFWLINGETEMRIPIDPEAIRLPGVFNRENIAAAILGALEIGVPLKTACKTAEQFEGLRHRLQFVAEHRGIRYYNDSYATRPDATLGAVATFRNTPLALILGGSEKEADFTELATVLGAHPTLRHVSLIGATAPRLKKALTTQSTVSFDVKSYNQFEEAIRAARDALGPEGTVLLSPACASFGLFPNYKVRGERFVGVVKKLISTRV